MRKQQGITLIGMLLTMAVVVIAGIVVMRVVPVYLEHYAVVTSLASLNKLPPTEFSLDPASNANILRSKLINQLYVNSIESIKPEEIKIIPNGEGKFSISVKYEVTRPLVGNIRLLFDFQASQEVNVSAE